MSSLKIFKQFIKKHKPVFDTNTNQKGHASFCAELRCQNCIAVMECREIESLPTLSKEEMEIIKIESPEYLL